MEDRPGRSRRGRERVPGRGRTRASLRISPKVASPAGFVPAGARFVHERRRVAQGDAGFWDYAVEHLPTVKHAVVDRERARAACGAHLLMDATRIVEQQ